MSEEITEKSTVKGTDAFTKAINTHLTAYSKKDPLFLKKLANPKKSIDGCVTFIFNHVKNSGQHGYTDDEVYQLARHYYDEDDIKPGTPITGGEVIVNQQINMSEEEIAEAKAEARKKVIDDEMARMKGKKEKKPTMTIVEKSDDQLPNQQTLF